MPMVMCNKAAECGSDDCRFLEPSLDIEMPHAHCHKVNGQVNILTIPDKDIKDPNWAFVRKKNGF